MDDVRTKYLIKGTLKNGNTFYGPSFDDVEEAIQRVDTYADNLSMDKIEVLEELTVIATIYTRKLNKPG